jgi:ankyrin repeat protein
MNKAVKSKFLTMGPDLYAAAWAYKFDEVRALIDELGDDLDVEWTDEDSTTALAALCIGKQSDLCQKLIQMGADVNARRSDNGKTVLMEAAGRGLFDVVKLMVEKGADVATTDKFDNKASDFAEMDKHKEIQEYLQARE